MGPTSIQNSFYRIPILSRSVLYSLGRGNSTGRVSPANKKISQIGRVSPGGRVSPETTLILRLDRGRVSEARFSGNFPKTDPQTLQNHCFLIFSGASRQILTRRTHSNAKLPEFNVSGGVEFPRGVGFPRGSSFPGNDSDLKMAYRSSFPGGRVSPSKTVGIEYKVSL